MLERSPEFSIDASPAEFPLGRFPLLSRLSDLVHGVTTLAGPDFRPPAASPEHARAAGALAEALGLRSGAWLRQVHGNRVLAVDTEGLAGEADGLVTLQPGLALLARGADCLLVLAAGPLDGDGPRVAGVAHASWRGTVAGVSARLIEAMAALSGLAPARMAAALSPSAGPCCYEVGPEVREAALAGLGPAAAAHFAPRVGATTTSGASSAGGKLLFDLWGANAAQLRGAGLPAANIAVAGICTICGPDHFPSYRRQGEAAGRIVAALGWLAPPARQA
jgi:hypothetical protein